MSGTMERWKQVREIFDRAVELEPPERDRLVAELAGDDVELGREVLGLLSALDREGGRLERLRPFEVFEGEATEPAGIRLGAYRLLREVGEGGMGSVYEAVRDDDQFEKRVAIKLIRRGMASEGLVRRFRQERQILAGLEHPHIARLLDGGTTADGRPYLVMEYVDGEPVTRYCEGNQLSLRDRLHLFVAVCDAVQHAHRHLVVHRDLKPGNILVSPDGGVKLLDFGVAKLMPEPGRGGVDPQATATLHRPFTPAYASPEQVRGEPVTTATDVYSLGVILYELLAGRHPFDLEVRSPLEMVQRLETEPARPSEAATLPGAGSPAFRLRRTQARELDNIVLKAMRKEPARRYGSVEQLAEDVRRFLDGRPVLAQRDTVGYRLRKLGWRHRTGVAAAALVLASLVGGVAVASSQARRAAIERDRAQVEARKAERISSFLVDMLRAPDPWVEARDVRVSELLAGAAARAADEFAADPEVLAEVQTAVGMSYAGLGSFDDAEPLLASALRIRRGLPGTTPIELAMSLRHYAGLLLYRGDPERAEPLLREALALIRSTTPEDSMLLANLRGQMGSLLQARGAWEEAGREHEAVLALRRDLLGPEHPDVAQSLNDLAVVRGQQGDFAAAERLLREAVEIQRAAMGPDHPDLAAGLTNLGFITAEQGRFEAADSFYREGLALRTRVLGPEHPDVAWTHYNYATMLHERGDFAGAEQNARQVLALRGHTLPDEHPLVAASLQVVGRSLAARNRTAEAEGLLRESLAVRRATLPTGHWLTASAESVLGDCLSDRGRLAEAEPLLLSGYEGLLAATGPDHPRTREAADRLARFYILCGDTARAAAYRPR
jgi:eukaryotic-like serine/threonine-protein kinase